MPLTLPTISTIANWYWINNSSQIFGSNKNAIVPSNDPGYLSFVAQGNLLAEAERRESQLRTSIKETEHKVARLKDYEQRIEQHTAMQRLW